MDNFGIMFKILKYLEEAMDDDMADAGQISHDRLGISRNRWEDIILMLYKNGYIEGVLISQALGQKRARFQFDKLKITLQGLQFLEENSLIKKAANIIMGVASVIK